MSDLTCTVLVSLQPGTPAAHGLLINEHCSRGDDKRERRREQEDPSGSPRLQQGPREVGARNAAQRSRRPAERLQ